MEHLNHGVKCRIPQAPWVLFFDGASRKPAAHGGSGIVLRNSKGQIVEEEKRFLGAGISSGLAKYKALLAGLKKAKGLQVKHLLAKGNSRILINQVMIILLLLQHVQSFLLSPLSLPFSGLKMIQCIVAVSRVARTMSPCSSSVGSRFSF